MSTMTEFLPKVTVAVCVHNGEQTLARCLQSITRLNYPSDNLNILVVDNASTDGTTEIIRQFPVNWCREEKLGRSHARNRACLETSTPFIAFTDADCHVHPDWLIHLMPCFISENLGAAGGKIITEGDSPLARFYEQRRIVSNEEFIGDYPFSPPFLATANCAFRLSVFNKTTGFDPELNAGEDADLCWRIRDLGYELCYQPDSVVYHAHRMDVKGLFRQSVDYGFHGVALLAHHRERFGKSVWIWWGLYARLAGSIIKFPFTYFHTDDMKRQFAYFDMIRYAGLSLGRIRASIKYGILAV